MKTFNFKKINYVMRVVQTENDKFKFDVLYKSNLIVTNNKEYESIKECIMGMASYCEELANISERDTLTVEL